MKKNKLLIVVDMQNDFVTGSLANPAAEKIIPNIIEKLKVKDYTYLIFTRDTHQKNYLETQEGKNLPVAHCIEGTLGWSINKQISSYADYCSNFLTYSTPDIRKSRIIKTTFGSLELANIIRSLVNDNPHIEIDEIILMGVCTDICVISNAMLLKAYCPEVPITVDASCCAGVTPESHKNALAAMKMCQINIINE